MFPSPLRIVSPRLFRDRFLFEVAISFFVAKLVCRRARPDGLDQWRIAQIFLYRACGLGLRLQNKEYLCAILGAIEMNKIENNFSVTGFVAKDAEVRQFTTTSVARFPLAVARQEKNGEDTKRISAFMNIEAWRKNENTGSFDQLTKGTLLTVEGYFKPEEWTDKDGVLHNRIVTVAVKFYPAVDKEEEVPAEPAKKPKKGKK